VGSPAGEVRQLSRGCNRLRMCAVDTWERVFTAPMAQADVDGDLDWAVSVDSTIVRAHQYSAGAHKKRAPVDEPDAHAIGRSRAGPTTKIHLAAGGRCDHWHSFSPPDRLAMRPSLPPSFAAYACPGSRGGPAQDRTSSWPTRHTFPRDPRSPAQTRHPDGDPGTGGSAWPQTASRQPWRRPPAFDREAYKQRNTVERCINRLGQ
jgi:transposase